MAAPPVNRAMKSRAAAPAPAASAAPKSARTGAAAQAPAKSMRQLNKENEDLQIKVEELSSSLHSAQAGKQAAKAAFEKSSREKDEAIEQLRSELDALQTDAEHKVSAANEALNKAMEEARENASMAEEAEAAQQKLNKRAQDYQACLESVGVNAVSLKEWTQRDAEKQQDVIMLEEQIQKAMDELKDTRKALQEDVQREDDYLNTITEFRKQLKMNKEAADEELESDGEDTASDTGEEAVPTSQTEEKKGDSGEGGEEGETDCSASPAALQVEESVGDALCGDAAEAAGEDAVTVGKSLDAGGVGESVEVEGEGTVAATGARVESCAPQAEPLQEAEAAVEGEEEASAAHDDANSADVAFRAEEAQYTGGDAPPEVEADAHKPADSDGDGVAVVEEEEEVAGEEGQEGSSFAAMLMPATGEEVETGTDEAGGDVEEAAVNEAPQEVGTGSCVGDQTCTGVEEAAPERKQEDGVKVEEEEHGERRLSVPLLLNPEDGAAGGQGEAVEAQGSKRLSAVADLLNPDCECPQAPAPLPAAVDRGESGATSAAQVFDKAVC